MGTARCASPCWTPWWVGNLGDEIFLKKYMASKNLVKRGRQDLDCDSDSEIDVRTKASAYGLIGTWQKFVVVEGSDPERPLDKLSPFAIQKGFEGISKNFTSVKRLRGGSFLIECSGKKSSEILLKRDGSIFVDRPIRVYAHKTLNSCKGVIRCPALKDVSELEIREELASQGVSEVKRVFVKKGDQKIPTNTLFLTFVISSLPEDIKVGYMRVKVTPFIPSPLRCFQCQRFGHSSRYCKNTAKCGKCSEEAHEGDCSKTTKCINCEGKHPSFSKDCPQWKLEAQIQKVRVERRVTFVEAKRLVIGTTASSSYAAVVQKKVESGCQTELTWLTGSQPSIVQSPGSSGLKNAATQAQPPVAKAKPAATGGKAAEEQDPVPSAVLPASAAAQGGAVAVAATPLGGGSKKGGPVVTTQGAAKSAPSSVVKPQPQKPPVPQRPSGGRGGMEANKNKLPVLKTGPKKAEAKLLTSNRFEALSDDDYMDY